MIEDKTDFEWLKCRECEGITQRGLWHEEDIECDSCGGHLGLRCPACDRLHDLTFDNDSPIEVSEDVLDGLDFFKKKEETK